MKYCKSCKIEHPLTKEFWYPKRDKVYGTCAIRARERRRIWSKNNRDKINVYKRKHDYKYKQSVKGRFSTLKKECKRRNILLDISLEEYKSIIQNNSCEYCGGNLPKNGTGLDRIDSNKGYHLDNLVPCCYNCNRIKNDLLNYEETKILIGTLKKLRGTKNVW